MNGPFNPDRLSLARDLRGMTQIELAAISGVDQGSISKYESGQMIPVASAVQKIAEALRFPVAFFYLDGKRQPPIWCTQARPSWERRS